MNYDAEIVSLKREVDCLRKSLDEASQRIPEKALAVQAEMVEALESTSDAFFAITADWLITAVNSVHEKRSQIPRAQQIGKNFLDLFFNSSELRNSIYFENYQRAIEEKVQVHFEAFYEPRQIWTGVTASPRKDGGISVFYRDITSEKLSRDLIVSHQKWLELVLDELPASIYMVDPTTGHYSFGNKAMNRLLGHPVPMGVAREITGLEIVAFDIESGQRLAFDEFPSTRALRGESVRDFRVTWRTNLGDHHVSVTATIVPEAYGNLSQIILAAVDITDQVNSARALAESMRAIEKSAEELSNEKVKLEAMISKSSAGIALMRGPQFVFEMVNEKFKDLVSPREYIGRPWAEVYYELPNSPLLKLLTDVYLTGDTVALREIKLTVEISSNLTEDRFYDIDYARIPIDLGSGWGIFCQTINVTDRVKRRHQVEADAKALSEAVKNLELEREAKNRFVLALTHDLRTPLTAIKMSAQLLNRKSDNPDFVKTISRRIANSIDRGDKLIKDLLDANQIKAGGALPLQLQEMDLHKVARSSLAELSTIHGERFKLIICVPSIMGFWDPHALERMIENLGSNAVKYGSKTAPITLTLTRENDFVAICMNNTGNAIDPNDLESIFTQYSRTTSAVSGGQIGWGVGLTLVKGIAEAHGGSAKVESNPDSGTTFTIQIPIDSRPKK